MPRIAFDGDSTPDEMPLAPVGTPIKFEVSAIEDEESKSSGKAMLHVQLKLEAPGDEAWDGDTMHDYFVEPQTNKRTQVAFKILATAVGVVVGKDGVDTEELLGQSGQVVLKKDSYDGRETRRIASYVKP